MESAYSRLFHATDRITGRIWIIGYLYGVSRQKTACVVTIHGTGHGRTAVGECT